MNRWPAFFYLGGIGLALVRADGEYGELHAANLGSNDRLGPVELPGVQRERLRRTHESVGEGFR